MHVKSWDIGRYCDCYKYKHGLPMTKSNILTDYQLQGGCHSPNTNIHLSVPNQDSERSCICVLEVMYLCVRGHVFVLEVMHLCVRGHAFVCKRSCICVLEVMHLCVRSHVFVCQRSCICVLEVMYLCVRGHVFVCKRYRFCLFLRFSYWILELFRQCDINCFSKLFRQCDINCFSILLPLSTRTNYVLDSSDMKAPCRWVVTCTPLERYQTTTSIISIVTFWGGGS